MIAQVAIAKFVVAKRGVIQNDYRLLLLQLVRKSRLAHWAGSEAKQASQE